MLNSDIKFSVEPALAEKGLKIRFATFSVPDIPRRRGSGLDQHIREVLALLDIDKLLQSPIIAEYKRLQKEAGIQEPVAPAEHLLRLTKKSGLLPNINRVVDSYNIASAETLLSMGAHDLAHIKGDVQLKTTDGTEKYTPLFKNEPEKVAPGEYAAMDEAKILCRLDLKQCDETKCGEATKEFLVYVQGNAETSDEYVLSGLQKVCDNIRNFCDGEYLIRG
jgi:DNA/RNA-binding domain of Phe-tRNA-synthetase-like protein